MKRHDLAYLHSHQSFTVLDSVRTEVQNCLYDRIRQGVPFTVCRQTLPNATKLATSCFIGDNKHRVSIMIHDKPKQLLPPLALSELCLNRLADVKSVIDEFVYDCHALNATCHVYGSYANQYFTGLNFVHDASDLDLLVVLNDDNQCLNVLSLIHQFKQTMYRILQLSIDGEIRIGDNDVSFNELISCIHHGIDTILVKTVKDIHLKSIHELLKGDNNEFSDFIKTTSQ